MSLCPIPVGLRRQLPSPDDSPWSLDPNASARMTPVAGKNYATALLSPFDREAYFVQRYFQQDPPPGFGIKAIHVIHNNDLQKSFESALAPMEVMATTFRPNWDQVEPKDTRKDAMGRLATMTQEFNPFSHQRDPHGPPTVYNGVSVLPLWHGTASHVAEAISNTGFTYFGKTPSGGLASGSTDDGFFGKGIYLTSSADYANKYVPSSERDRGTLLLCWAAFREPFPIVSDVPFSNPGNVPTDMQNIRGQTLFGSYNAHYIPVRSIDPDDPSNLNYYPCAINEQPRYDEFVVKEAAQTLVRYRIELGVTLPHALPTAQLMNVSHASKAPVHKLYPNPEDNPLIRAQLESPGQSLSVEESTSLLTQCIKYGTLRAKKAKDRDMLLLIGNTGAGKSTTANYLAGCTMQAVNPRDIGMSGISKIIVVVPPEKGGALAEVMPIGHTKASKTFMPHIETPPGAHPLTYCDCPGFLDNRGAEINIANAVNIRAAIQQAKSVKMLILINYFSLLADRGRGLKDVLKICTNLFGQPETLLQNKHSLLIGVTNTPLDLTLPELKNWIVEDSVPLMKNLQDRLFFFDPLDRVSEETGRWNRENCLSQIEKLKPITSHRKIFNTVLTDEDENSLVRISEEIGNNVEKALREKNYPEAASQLRSLEELSIIEHITLERLIRSQLERLQGHFYKYINQFKSYCSLDKFTEARNLFTELQLALFHFPKLTPFFNQEQLPEYYSSCYQKYDQAQQRDLAFQKLLTDAEARSERSETRIQEFIVSLKNQEQAALAKSAEQEKSYQLHIQQLQAQINKITLNYEEAKRDLEKERQEREEKIAKRIEELSRSGMNEEAAKLTTVREQLSAEYDGKLRQAGGTFSQQIKEQHELQAQIERNKKEQEERHQQELAKIQAQTLAQEKAMAIARELEKEKLKKLAQEDAVQFKQEGDALYQENKFAEALKKYEESLSRLEMLSSKSLDVATCSFKIAETHQQVANLPSALEYYQKAASIQGLLAPNSPDLATVYHNMGQVYELKKEFPKALEHYHKSLEIRELDSQNRHHVAECHDHLKQVYTAQGKLGEAKGHHLKSLGIRMNFTPRSLREGGAHKLLKDDFFAELEEHQKNLAIQERLAPESIDLAAIYHNIGRAFQSQELLPEALEFYQKSCRMRERLIPNSLELAVSYHNIGLVYHNTQRFSESLEQYKKCLAIEESLIPDTMVVAATYNNIGRVYAEQKQFPEALIKYQKSLTIKERDNPDSITVATTSHNIGLVHQAQEKFSVALKYFEKSLAIRKRLASESLDLVASYQSVGSVLFSLKNLPEALQCTLQVVDLYKKLAPNSLILAAAHESARQIYYNLQQFSQAMEQQQLCLAIREKLVPDSLTLADTYFAQGDLLIRLAQSGSSKSYQDQLSEALQFYHKCLIIRESKHANNITIAECYSRIGNIYHAQGKESEAKASYQRSFTTRYPLESSGSVDDRLPNSTIELTPFIQRCKDYSSDRSDKVAAVCELQTLLERRAAGSIHSRDVLTHVEAVLNKPDNPILASWMLRKSDVKTLFENARDGIKLLR